MITPIGSPYLPAGVTDRDIDMIGEGNGGCECICENCRKWQHCSVGECIYSEYFCTECMEEHTGNDDLYDLHRVYAWA